MSSRMALGFVCSLALMLQTLQDYPVNRSGRAVGPI
jgi:hypothetical protein